MVLLPYKFILKFYCCIQEKEKKRKENINLKLPLIFVLDYQVNPSDFVLGNLNYLFFFLPSGALSESQHQFVVVGFKPPKRQLYITLAGNRPLVGLADILLCSSKQAKYRQLTFQAKTLVKWEEP